MSRYGFARCLRCKRRFLIVLPLATVAPRCQCGGKARRCDRWMPTR